MDLSRQLTTQLITETRRRLMDEGVVRLKKCFHLLTEEEIWYRPNKNSNSIGNITLHLAGNVRQWLLAGLGGQQDIRRRQEEFDEKGPIPVAKLIQTMDNLMTEVAQLLDNLSAEDLVKTHHVQGFEETGVGILIHVVEHFSYHVGQITYFVKAVKDIDTKYYADVDLETKS